jgi:hypothetical protein
MANTALDFVTRHGDTWTATDYDTYENLARCYPEQPTAPAAEPAPAARTETTEHH